MEIRTVPIARSENRQLNPAERTGVSAYDETFFKGQRDASFVAASRMLPEVVSLVPCRSMLDIGCGVGPWVAAALRLGITDTLGIDGSYVDRSLLLIPQHLFQPHDLAEPFDLGRKFDLLVCMEVAEHLGPQYADVLIDNLARHGDTVLFSAAIPGQGGTNHINEQWPDYWCNKFLQRGYRQLDVIRRRIWDDDGIPVCYRQNAYLFVSETKLRACPALLSEAERPHPSAWIHPDLFVEALHRPLPLRRILRELPEALTATLRARLARVVRRQM